MNNFNERRKRKIEFLNDLNNVLVKHDAEIITTVDHSNDDGMFMYFDLNQGSNSQYDQELGCDLYECCIDSNSISNLLKKLYP